MDDLLLISIGSLSLSILTEFIYNYIALSMVIHMENEHYKKTPEIPFRLPTEMVHEIYRLNRPEILRENKILDTIIILGNKIFYLIFSMSFLVMAYLINNSIFWTLLCIPGLIFFKFILNLLIISLSRVLIRTKMKRYM